MNRRGNVEVLVLGGIVVLLALAGAAAFLFLRMAPAPLPPPVSVAASPFHGTVPGPQGYTLTRESAVREPDKSWKITVLAVRTGPTPWAKLVINGAKVVTTHPPGGPWKAMLVSGPQGDLDRVELVFFAEAIDDLSDKELQVDLTATYRDISATWSSTRSVPLK